MNTTEHLTRTLMHVVMFLEFSSDDDVDPDLAIQQLEDITSSLQELDAATACDLQSHGRGVRQ